MQVTNPFVPAPRGAPSPFRAAMALALASVISLAAAGVLAYLAFQVSVLLGVVGGTALLLLQLPVHLRAARWETAAARRAAELAARNEQLHLAGRLADALCAETRRRRMVRVLLDFCGAEVGAPAAVFWTPNAEGEPEAPTVAQSPDPPTGRAVALAEAHRVLLARGAAGSGPLVVSGIPPTSRPFDPRQPSGGPFVLFFPLRSGETCEGVLELHGQGGWRRLLWELIPALARQAAAALERARRYEEVRERADVDYVTGLYNHRFMHSYLHRLLAAFAGRRRRLAVVLMDVDDFKAFNDKLGHSAGDRVLQTVADQLRLMSDRVGLVGRFGGDEFIVILPDEDRPGAEAFAVALQDWLSGTYAGTAQVGLPVRVSWGVAVFPDDADNRQRLLAAADARLYAAKRASRRPEAGVSTGRAAEPSLPCAFDFLGRLVSEIDSTDHYTRAHCERAAEFAVTLAQELGLSPAAQRILRLAALLHDVGKIGIPDDVLRKPGPLTPEEFDVVKHHVSIAGHLIVDLPNAEEIRTLVLHHHERWDGSGYPD
ncbi:MAG TPA: diguanylate cyclase, partial [Dehalococcoidia bacterium]|nr:diguanylate cyclase [Dehalococcoidia bacterium]